MFLGDCPIRVSHSFTICCITFSIYRLIVLWIDDYKVGLVFALLVIIIIDYDHSKVQSKGLNPFAPRSVKSVIISKNIPVTPIHILICKCT